MMEDKLKPALPLCEAQDKLKKHKKDVELVTRYLNELAAHGIGTVAMDAALNDYKDKELKERLVRQSFEVELKERAKEFKAQTITEKPEEEIPIVTEGFVEIIETNWPSPIDKDKMVLIPAYLLQPWQRSRASKFIGC